MGFNCKFCGKELPLEMVNDVRVVTLDAKKEVEAYYKRCPSCGKENLYQILNPPMKDWLVKLHKLNKGFVIARESNKPVPKQIRKEAAQLARKLQLTEAWLIGKYSQEGSR